MGEQTAIFMLSIAGAIISLLLLILGFFSKKLIDSVDNLNKAVIALKTIFEFREKESSESHKAINAELKEHACILNEHGTEIEILKLKIKSETK